MINPLHLFDCNIFHKVSHRNSQFLDGLHLLSVEYHMLKGNITHKTFGIISLHQRWVLTIPVIGNILKQYIFNASSGSLVVFGIIQHSQMKELTFLDTFDSNVTKGQLFQLAVL